MPPEGDDPNAKPAFTEEQLAGLKPLINNIVNSAIASRDRMADKKRAEDREAVTNAFSKMLDEKLAALKPADDPGGGGGGKDGKDGGGGRKSALELELTTLKRQREEDNKRMAEAEKRANDARARVEAAELRDRAARILGESKIEGKRFQGAYALLKDSIRRQSDEPDAPYVFINDLGEEVELEQGLRSWAKSDDAKLYIPPSGAGGSGARPVRQPPGGSQKKEVTFEDVGNAVLGLVGGGQVNE